MKDAVSLLPILAIAVIFWLLILRPASRARKATAELQAALTVGDDVMLASGIFATIVGEADDHLEVEIAPGVAIRVVRGAVASVRRDLAEDAPGTAAPASDEAQTAPESTTDQEER